MQQLGVCLDEERKRQQAGPMLRRFIAVYLARLPPDASGAEGTLQALWDLAFLERLSHMWGEDTSEMSERITAGISCRRDVSGDRLNVPGYLFILRPSARPQ